MTQMLISPTPRVHTGEVAQGLLPLAVRAPLVHMFSRSSWALLTARLPEAQHTPLALDRVLDPSVREALAAFDRELEMSLGEPLAACGITPHKADNDAVAAVAYVAQVLGVPERDVLTAAGIKERTFHEWKRKGREPRLGSQGRLWKLVQVVEDLAEHMSDPAAWLRADEKRRETLRSGDPDALAAEAVQETLARARAREGLVLPDAAGYYSLGDESVGPEPSPHPQRSVQRRSTRLRTTRASIKRS
jgi:hypothetical protein